VPEIAESAFGFDLGLSSPWLDAQAHYEALSDYVNELPTLFAHHSTQMRLREQHYANNFLRDPSLSEEDRHIVHCESRDKVETYENRLRQIICSPAITAVISCFEHYMRTAFKIRFEDKRFPGARNAQLEIAKTDPDLRHLYSDELCYIIQARNIISHVNGWIEFYDFDRIGQPSKHEFLRWASEHKFYIDDLKVLTADAFSAKHCFEALEPLFISLPTAMNN
jgi:hypothetical protein